MTTRLHTQDATHQLDGLSSMQRSIRLILADKLTEVQNRRMTLLFGLDGGPGMGVREAARAEGVRLFAVQKSAEGAVARLANDWRLWGYWLLQDDGVVDSYGTEETPLHLRARNGATRTRPVKSPDDPRNQNLKQEIVQPDDDAAWGDVEAGEKDGFGAYELRRGDDAWESDAHNPAPSTTEAYGDGWIARNENVPESENPYNGEKLQRAWRDGWNDAGLRTS